MESSLKKNHEYYYQVQTQVGISKIEICFFVVWTERELHVEVITFDSNRLREICEKTHALFRTTVLSELVGKFYMRLITSPAMDKQFNSNNRQQTIRK